jgi:two-component sensor histidine kinase
LIALALTAAAAGLRAALQPVAPDAVPFAPFFVSTLLAALLGGAPAGLVAAGAAMPLAWYLFLPPVPGWTLSVAAVASLALFIAAQVALVGLAAVLRRSLHRARAAEAALRGGEARLRAIFEQLPAAAFVAEAPDGEISLRSRRVAELLPGADPLACPATRPDGRALSRADHPAMRSLAAGEAVDAEPLRVAGAEDGPRFLEVSSRPVRDAQGRIVAAVCAAFDVSARQEAEEAWQRKATELEAVMTLAPVGVWFTYDPEVRRVTRNRFAAELLRAPHESSAPLSAGAPVRLTHVSLWRDGRRVEAAEMPLQRAMRGEESRDEEYEAVFADGTSSVLLSNAQPLRDAAGRIIGAVSASLDITARKRAETALREAMVQREMLQREADHRIKNSLQIVSSVLRLQRARLSDPAAVAMLDEAIGRIAAVAEAHAALHQSEDLRMVDVGTMVRDLSRHVGQLNPDVAIRCVQAGAALLEAQRAIPLGLIVSELLTNAVRHAYPAGTGGEVQVTVGQGVDGLEIEVRDDGVGLPDSAANRPGSLGAALVQSFAARIGATVAAASTTGEGTTVRIVLGRQAPVVTAA